MGWVEVWRLAMKHFVAEPVELRILIGLGLVFLALMVVVGLKHAFRSAEPQPDLPVPERQPVPNFVAAPMAMAMPSSARCMPRRALRGDESSLRPRMNRMAAA